MRLAKRPQRVDVFLATSLYFLNVIDTFLTLYVVRVAGTSMEMNPFLHFLFTFGEIPFLLTKLVGGLLLTLILLFYPLPRRYSMGLVVATIVYFCFTSYHLWGVING